MPRRVTGRLAGPRERRPRSRLSGCLLWLLALIIVLIILSLLFGSFRRGTRTGGVGPLSPIAVASVPATSLIRPVP
jgi:hypothetical protein